MAGVVCMPSVTIVPTLIGMSFVLTMTAAVLGFIMMFVIAHSLMFVVG